MNLIHPETHTSAWIPEAVLWFLVGDEQAESFYRLAPKVSHALANCQNPWVIVRNSATSG